MDDIKDIMTLKNQTIISGLTKELNIFCMLNNFKNNDNNVLIVTSSLYETNKYYESLKDYTEDVYVFPMDDFLTSVASAISPELKITRLETLKKITENKKVIVITNLMGYLKFITNKNEYQSKIITLKKGMEFSHSKLISIIEDYGYKRDSLVTSTGEYASRGFIIDIFLPMEEHPLRIEFFGDEIESIRFFNETSQLSLNNIENINILPINENYISSSTLYNYMNHPQVYFIDYDQILETNNRIENEIVDYKNSINDNNTKYMFELNDILPKKEVYLNTFSDNSFNNYPVIKYNSEEIINFNGDYDKLKAFVNKNYTKKILLFLVENKKEEKIIFEIFDGYKVEKNSNKLGQINIINKKLKKGFIINKYIFLCFNDLENNKNIISSTYRNSFKIGRKIKDYAELNNGDYVVHVTHGIGVYNGVVTLSKNGILKDYIQLNYKDNDKIYIPVEKIENIFRYTSKDGTSPKVDKIGGTSWLKRKNSVKAKIKDISAELIKLYAERSASTSPKYIDFPEELLFANDFAFKETEDQLKAIKDIDNDLKKNYPMDRLLCGDVGFGKTEVAFRGIFKTVINGFQVSYLCPTTILSKQQFELAKRRFTKYGINIALLNRFVPVKKQKIIIEQIKNGKVDIIFGTHRLLSQDIKYKNLGMLVIDEEQRFGVTHKEKIKQIKNNINVLSLSATPIPRTLKLALSGLRDLSIIDTAPLNRFPVQTYVMAENDLLIKDAIYKELSRDGQVFILYNNIQHLEDIKAKINNYVPEAKIKVAHGRMNKTELENIMEEFILKEFDILLCTTIIETGIDIPNVNTLIIYDADHFGLSQLYQLRGRVGRSNKIGYAYLLYSKSKLLNDIAVKRLQAIKEFTELGSGYKIAMRDITIRGSGDLLGSEQAGFVDSVGLEMYMKLVEDEIKVLNGQEVLEEDINDSNLIDVKTHIDDDYVTDEKIKIEIHKKINEIDSLEKLNEVKTEIEDRFGKINEELNIYMYNELFESIAEKIKITKILQTKEYVQIEIPKDTSANIKGDKLLLVANNITSNFYFSYKFGCINIKLKLNGLNKHFIYYLVELFSKIF